MFKRKLSEAKAERDQFWIYATLAVVGVILFGLLITDLKSPSEGLTPVENPAVDWLRPYQIAALGYHTTTVRLPDNWALIKPAQEGPEERRKHLDYALSKVRLTEGALRKYSRDPRVKQLSALFGGKIQPGVFLEPYFANPQTVLLIPYPVAVDRKFMVSFDSATGGVIFAALDWTDAWWEAQIIKELLYVRYAYRKLPRTKATDEQIEIEGHDLQRAVLDLQTNGRYTETARKAVADKNAPDLKQFAGRITARDLIEMDKVLAPPKTGREA